MSSSTSIDALYRRGLIRSGDASACMRYARLARAAEIGPTETIELALMREAIESCEELAQELMAMVCVRGRLPLALGRCIAGKIHEQHWSVRREQDALAEATHAVAVALGLVAAEHLP